MEAVSAVIITKNEEKYIEGCLKSLVDVADEILVLDSESTDGTRAICERFKVRFLVNQFDGYISQKNRATKLATHDLILSLDGDEALSEEARQAILEIKSSRQYDGYFFPRRNHYCGKWMRYTSMYPDKKLRLFDRTKADWGGIDPHDRVVMHQNTKTKTLDGNILHWVFDQAHEHKTKSRQFAEISALACYQAGKRTGILAPMFHSLWRFLDEYIVHLGILAGQRGWNFSRYSTRYVWLKYVFLRDLQIKNKKDC